MAVNGNDGFVDIGDAIEKVRNNAAEFFRKGIADSVGNVNCGGACGDGIFNHAAKVINRRATGIFAGKLDIISVVSGLFNAGCCHRHDVFAAFLKFVLDMNV